MQSVYGENWFTRDNFRNYSEGNTSKIVAREVLSNREDTNADARALNFKTYVANQTPRDSVYTFAQGLHSSHSSSSHALAFERVIRVKII